MRGIRSGRLRERVTLATALQAMPAARHPLGSSLPRSRGVFVNMLGTSAVAKTPIPVGETNG
jgi:hypothetical protein